MEPMQRLPRIKRIFSLSSDAGVPSARGSGHALFSVSPSFISNVGSFGFQNLQTSISTALGFSGFSKVSPRL